MQARLIQRLAPAYRRLFTQFRADSEAAAQSSLPFVPQVGREYEHAPVKLLVVGKVASLSWEEFEPAEAYRQQQAELLEDLQEKWGRFFERPIMSPFWRSCVTISRALGGSGLPSIAWSNVLKVGGRGPPHTSSWNPNAHVRRIQLDAGCLGMLTDEVNLLRPDAILFATGPGFDTYLRQAFRGLSGTSVPGTSITMLKGSQAKVAVRSRHFQGMRKTEQEMLVTLLSAAAPAHLRP